MISPLLWMLVVDEILDILAYADDIVIIILSGKFLNILSDIMEGTLK